MVFNVGVIDSVEMGGHGFTTMASWALKGFACLLSLIIWSHQLEFASLGFWSCTSGNVFVSISTDLGFDR